MKENKKHLNTVFHIVLFALLFSVFFFAHNAFLSIGHHFNLGKFEPDIKLLKQCVYLAVLFVIQFIIHESVYRIKPKNKILWQCIAVLACVSVWPYGALMNVGADEVPNEIKRLVLIYFTGALVLHGIILAGFYLVKQIQVRENTKKVNV